MSCFFLIQSIYVFICLIIEDNQTKTNATEIKKIENKKKKYWIEIYISFSCYSNYPPKYIHIQSNCRIDMNPKL